MSPEHRVRRRPIAKACGEAVERRGVRASPKQKGANPLPLIDLLEHRGKRPMRRRGDPTPSRLFSLVGR
jgi:hypothetical protein